MYTVFNNEKLTLSLLGARKHPQPGILNLTPTDTQKPSCVLLLVLLILINNCELQLTATKVSYFTVDPARAAT